MCPIDTKTRKQSQAQEWQDLTIPLVEWELLQAQQAPMAMNKAVTVGAQEERPEVVGISPLFASSWRPLNPSGMMRISPNSSYSDAFVSWSFLCCTCVLSNE